jgi:transcriptional regulator with XRE-family HTH domain
MRNAHTRIILGYIGANIRRIRKRHGLTQEELSEAADLDARFVQRIERGQINLSIDVLISIADALTVKPTMLFRPEKLLPSRVGRPAHKV